MNTSGLLHIVRLSAGVATLGVLLMGSTAFAAPQAPNQGVTANVSHNWSGYIANSGTYTGVSGSWTVPNVIASTNATADATWIGIGGASHTDLIQAGTQEISENGQVEYQAWYELLPSSSVIASLSVHPGDSISASIAQQPGNYWLITLTDNTTGQSYTNTVTYNSSLSSAEWIEEMPSDQNNSFIPLDSFGSVAFSHAQATVNGVTENLVGLGATPVTMTNNSQILATPSSVGSDDQSFTVTRSAASSDVGTPTVMVYRGQWRSGRGDQGQQAQQWQASSTSYTLSPGTDVHFTRYFVIPGMSTTTQSNMQTQTFSVGNTTFTIQFSL